VGAVEHLKTLCCLGLEPESAMIAVTPLLHEIIPHGWTRLPRSARPFTVDDVQRLDRLRPWLAHAFRPEASDCAHIAGAAWGTTL
jgi:hypothetical protein